MIGAGLGNTAAQRVNQALGLQAPGNLDKGQIAGSVIMGGMPGSSMAGSSVGGLIGAGAKAAAGNLAAVTAQTTIDEGRLPSLAQAAIAAGTGFAAPGNFQAKHSVVSN